MHQSEPLSNPQPNPPLLIPNPMVSNQLGHVLFKLLQIAGGKSSGIAAVYHIKKLIQALLNRTISPQLFVNNIMPVFGSYQPIYVHLITRELHGLLRAMDQGEFSILTKMRDTNLDEEYYRITQQQNAKTMAASSAPTRILPPRKVKAKVPVPMVSVNIKREIDDDFDIDAPFEPHLPLSTNSRPSLLSPPMTRGSQRKKNEEEEVPNSQPSSKTKDSQATSEDDIAQPASLDPSIASPTAKVQQPIPPKPIYDEPDNEFINAEAVLNFSNSSSENPIFKSITKDAVILLGEYVEVQFRKLLADSIKAAKHRTASFPNDLFNPASDVRKQLNILDAYYLAQDGMNNSNNNDHFIAKSNRQREAIDSHNDMNEAALAALGGRKLNFAAISKTAPAGQQRPSTRSHPSNIKTLKITAQDVLLAIEKDDRLVNSRVYRSILYVGNLSTFSQSAKF